MEASQEMPAAMAATAELKVMLAVDCEGRPLDLFTITPLLSLAIHPFRGFWLGGWEVLLAASVVTSNPLSGGVRSLGVLFDLG
jgi:hypothetical protein